MFKLNGMVIENASEVRYLGHTLTDDLKDDIDLKRSIGQMYGRGNMLVRKFANCTKQIKLLLFKLYITPIYCHTIWRETLVKNNDKLRVAYNNTLRALFRLPRRTSMSMFIVRNELKTIQELKRSLLTKFIDRLGACKNSLCNAAVKPFYLSLTNYGAFWLRALYHDR